MSHALYSASRKNVPCRARDIITDDADCLARSISGWVQEYEQLKAGIFRGSLTELCLGPTQLFLEKTSLALHQACIVPTGYVWFGLPLSEEHCVRINGTQVRTGCVAVHRGGERFELFTPDALRFWGIVVREDLLFAYARQFECADWLADALDSPVLAVEETAKRELQAECSAILDDYRLLPTTKLSTSLRESISDGTLNALLSLLHDAAPASLQRATSQRRQRLVDMADAYVRSCDDRLVTISELCLALNVSRRSLQASFQEALGISPHSYIRAVSLNRVRSHLKNPESPYRSVQDAAAAFGFWHMSQFALDYRVMFGERPSETLRRREGGGEH